MNEKIEEGRPTVIIGNWKMNKTIVEARMFVSGLTLALSHCKVKVGLAVPFTMIEQSAEAARGTSIAIGAQNVSEMPDGAFTGEISCALLNDAGASFVIVGHSERRHFYHENDELINCKIKSARSSGLKVILCIGETLEQREAGDAHKVLAKQLKNCLKDINLSQGSSLMISYEPIWAIGTGNSATPEIAQQAHAFCRETIATIAGSNYANDQILLYGGSVNLENAEQLLHQRDIDGLLVGGASLNLDSFTKIIQCQSIFNS